MTGRNIIAEPLNFLSALGGMHVNQAIASIRHGFGGDVDPSVMRETVEALFGV